MAETKRRAAAPDSIAVTGRHVRVIAGRAENTAIVTVEAADRARKRAFSHFKARAWRWVCLQRTNRRGIPLAACAHPLETIFVFALLVRLVNVALLRGNHSFFAETDTHLYWALGAGWRSPDVLAEAPVMTDRMPLFPLLLAGVQGTLGDVPRAVAGHSGR